MRARIARSLRCFSSLPGGGRLVNKLVPQQPGKFEVRNGDTYFAGNLESFIDRQVYLFGGYEVTEMKCFLSHVPATRRGTILDIGANVGTHSLQFAKAFKAVHAFEPNPMIWAQFERNMQLNNCGNVHLHKVGLADADTELPLHLTSKTNYGLGTFSTVEQYDRPLKPAAVCPIRHAANYVTNLGVKQVDAIKIDVQGFEPEVLGGLRAVLERDRPIVWCEIGAGTLTKMDHISALSALLPFQFRCYQMDRVSRHAIKLRERNDVLVNDDYLIVPR
jgi:FkbM family methyltransferase